ncbi:unnamed protein product [Taenia asiatica]|uniref:NADH dehydrogenase [ubiquinone] 1 beta subcomplex subunit 2, mitochondrial n=1 Tax=Taenia asiatica TaxID=60517 RepID=A0A0R3W724_TAEAS|nr:unnamed protein product [Taenia asiatica]
MEVGRAMLRLSHVHQLLRPATQTIKRYSHGEVKVYYRDHTHYDEKSERAFRIGSTILWAWISYHFINNWEMLIGHDPYPKRESFTDAELGVE